MTIQMPTELTKFPSNSDHETSIIQRGKYFVVYCSCQTLAIELGESEDLAEKLAYYHREGVENAEE